VPNILPRSSRNLVLLESDDISFSGFLFTSKRKQATYATNFGKKLKKNLSLKNGIIVEKRRNGQ